MCSLAILHPWFPRRKHPWRLGGHEFNSYSWQNEKIQYFPTHFGKILQYLKVSTFSTSDREQNVFFCSFTSLISPSKAPLKIGGHEFNSYSWQNEKIQFSQKISTFSTSDRELNVFSCSFTSLIPLRKHPWRLGGHEINSYSCQSNFRSQFFSEDFIFSTSDREHNFLVQIPLRRDPCHRECHGLNSNDQPKKPLSR